MMNQLGIMLPLLALLLLLSAFFSSSETAYSSLNRIRIMKLAENGNKRAQIVLSLINDFDRLLSAILIGNNIVNIASSSIATVLFVAYFGNIGVTLSTIIMTILVLTFGEIFPKTLAKESPEQYALTFARSLKILVTIFYPLTLFFSGLKVLLMKLRPSKETPPSITEDELLILVEEAAQEGSIDPDDEVLIKSVVAFNDLEVQKVLVPRRDIVYINKKRSTQEISDLFESSGFSRLPYCEDSIDEISGVVNQKDFYYEVLRKKRPLSEIIKPISFITKSMKISELMKKFQSEQCHIAIVIDEYGGTEGLVTLEDVLEELVGEIWDEYDDREPEYQQLNKDRYLINGQADVDLLQELFGITDISNSSTVAGYVISSIDRIPQEGEVFKLATMEIKINRMEDHRIEEVIIESQELAETNADFR
ncbi:membrane protein [Enterococcus florum]|uniref:Membrane protein n=1 Tax=Enterococcus florum TaxID=2480627 RepID=A0A4V0WPG0_9ENTE|nr:hemolysin family protein [Enterococcus florum]GCF93729.1 membrane protein [Enterococcus florum]